MSNPGTPSLLSTIVADIENEWGAVVSVAESDAVAAWGTVSPILLSILPQQWTILKNLIETGITDLSTLSIEEVETALLNLAIAQELQFVRDLSSNILQAIIAVFKPATPSKAGA